MEVLTIGVLGLGFVGRAVYNSYTIKDDSLDKCFYDPFVRGSKTFDEFCSLADVIFVCLPTPKAEDGTVDASIIYEMIENLNNNIDSMGKHIIIKSTLTPDVYKKIVKLGCNLEISYVPEFLTANNADKDYLTTNRIIIGSDNNSHKLVEEVLRLSDIQTNTYIYVSVLSAIMIKYISNSFLASKIIFFNEIYDLVEKISDNKDFVWEEISQALDYDDRIGKTHRQVPGWDGERGYGGACFPKDVSAIVEFSKKNKYSLELLEKIQEINKSKYNRE